MGGSGSDGEGEGDGEGLRAEILNSRLEEVAGMIVMALGSIDGEISVGFTLAKSLRRSRGLFLVLVGMVGGCGWA